MTVQTLNRPPTANADHDDHEDNEAANDLRIAVERWQRDGVVGGYTHLPAFQR